MRVYKDRLTTTIPYAFATLSQRHRVDAAFASYYVVVVDTSLHEYAAAMPIRAYTHRRRATMLRYATLIFLFLRLFFTFSLLPAR